MRVVIADQSHSKYAEIICQTIDEAALVRGTGIAKRKPEYIITKLENGNAVIALDGDQFAGFVISKPESWQICSQFWVDCSPNYRGIGLAKQIKKVVLSILKLNF